MHEDDETDPERGLPKPADTVASGDGQPSRSPELPKKIKEGKAPVCPGCSLTGWIKSISTISNTAAAIVMAWFTSTISTESSKQSELIGQQVQVAEIDERPWIGAPDIKSNVCNEDRPGSTVTGGIATLTLKFNNAGKTATTGLYIGTGVIDKTHWREKADFFCDEGRKSAMQQGYHAYAMTPMGIYSGSDFDGYNYEKMNIKDLTKTTEPYVVGCVVYGSQFDTKNHQTKFYAPLLIDGNSLCVGNIFTIYPD